MVIPSMILSSEKIGNILQKYFLSFSFNKAPNLGIPDSTTLCTTESGKIFLIVNSLLSLIFLLKNF